MKLLGQSLLLLCMLGCGALRAQYGTILWKKHFGGTNQDRPSCMTMSDGWIYVAGTSESTDGDFGPNNGVTDLWVRKLNRQGEQQWAYHMGGSGIDRPQDIIVLPNGNVALVGYTTSTSLPEHRSLLDAILICLTPQGQPVYTRYLNGRGWAEYYGLQIVENLSGLDTAGNRLVMVGQTGNMFHYRNNDIHDTIKCYLDAWINWHNPTDGQNIWTNRSWRDDTLLQNPNLPDGYDDIAHMLNDVTHLDAGGNIAVGTAGHFFQQNFTDAYIAAFKDTKCTEPKTNGCKDTLWTRILGSYSKDEALRVVETADGNVVVLANAWGSGADVGTRTHGQGDNWVMKLAATTGATVWDTLYGNQYEQQPQDMVVVNDTLVAIAGYEDPGSGDHYRTYCMLLNSRTGSLHMPTLHLGDEAITCRAYAMAYDHEAQDLVLALSVEGTGTVFDQHQGDEDWWIVRIAGPYSRYAQVVGRPHAQPTAHLQAWPSPAGSYLHVQATLPLQHASLYTLAGQQVASWQQPGTRLQLPTLPAGLYVLQATDGHTHYSQRVMIQP